jgi:hypothetical protein
MKDSIYVRAMSALNNLLVVSGVVLGVALIATQATADPIEIPTYNYIDTTLPSEWDARTAVCDRTDVNIGIALGVSLAALAAVHTIARMPIVGPGLAAGAKVGLLGAITAPVLTGSTLGTGAGMLAVVGIPAGFLGYTGSCFARNNSTLKWFY